MEWVPSLGMSEEDDKYLSDMELKKVRDLQRSLRKYSKGPERTEIEKEICEVYIKAMKRAQKMYEEGKKEKLWNEVLQQVFNKIIRISVMFFLTLVGGGIILLFFTAATLLNELSETSIAILLQAIVIVSLYSIVVAVIGYRRMTKLKKSFESGEIDEFLGNDIYKYREGKL